jgi:T5SS/PEP-CTERM-associated repeat protein
VIKQSYYLSLLIILLAIFLCLDAASVQAVITTSGDVNPADASKWKISTLAYVGQTLNGNVQVDSGSDILSNFTYLGYSSDCIGEVTIDGDGSTWTNDSGIVIGNNGQGILNITNGGALSNYFLAFIGGYYNSNSNSIGVVNVIGSNSIWTNSADIYVGYTGNGGLNIKNGGTVNVTNRTYVAYTTGSTGTINFDSGTLSTGTLAASSSQLTGVGTINTLGIVTDADLSFNSTASLIQTLVFNNVKINFDISKKSNNCDLGVGWRDNGSLTISSGITVNSHFGVLGYLPTANGKATIIGTGTKWVNDSNLYVGSCGCGTLSILSGGWVFNSYGYVGEYDGSTGKVTVDGAGSIWYNSSELDVGFDGNGTLNVTNGGVVLNFGTTGGYIGNYSYSTGKVTVDGTNSKWANSRDLYVGREGKGTLNISGGGSVTAASVSINSKSLLAIDVGNGSQLTINNGTGAITNGGTIRILAGAKATAGIAYMPISAGTFSSGTYQPIGGTWNATAHTFTASVVQPGFSDAQTTVDLKNFQRLLIDGSLGASFAPTTTDTLLNFTASPIGGQSLLDLQTVLNANKQMLLSDWQISVTGGYTNGNPAYLSFNIGPGISRNDITVWHYDNNVWSLYDAADLTCNGGYASFTVTGFSGYALSSVPEPGTLILLASGLMSAFVYLRRRS